MEKLKDKIEKYINKTGVIKTPAYFIKELLISIIETIDKVNKSINVSIKQVNKTIEQNIVPYLQNKIVFDTEELNIDTKNGYYYTENLLENLKITKVDDTICPKVEFDGYFVKLQLPKSITLQNKFVDFNGYTKYIITFDNNNCKIDRYISDLSEYLIATYQEGTTKLSNNNSKVFTSLDRKYLNKKIGPVYENERLITKVGTSIGSNAFRECSGLTSVIIPDSVNSINYNAFHNCFELTSVEIGNSVNSIGDYAFSQCSKLTSISIPNSVNSIGNYAFEKCYRLTSVEIGNSVTSIGESPFNNCYILTTITVDENNLIYDSRDNCNAIIETSTNTLLRGGKNTIIPNSVTSIGNMAFFGCSELTSITIPNSVTSIGQQAFGYCSGLTSISIPNSVTSIGNMAFSGCYKFTSITIESTTPPTLGSGCFSNTNTNLKIYVPTESVDLYKSATNWSNYADKILPIPN